MQKRPVGDIPYRPYPSAMSSEFRLSFVPIFKCTGFNSHDNFSLVASLTIIRRTNCLISRRDDESEPDFPFHVKRLITDRGRTFRAF